MIKIQRKQSHRLDLILQGNSCGIYTTKELLNIKSIKRKNLKPDVHLIQNTGKLFEVLKLGRNRWGVQILSVFHAPQHSKPIMKFGAPSGFTQQSNNIEILDYIKKEEQIKTKSKSDYEGLGTSHKSTVPLFFFAGEKPLEEGIFKGDRVMLEIIPKNKPHVIVKDKTEGISELKFKNINVKNVVAFHIKVDKNISEQELEGKKMAYKERYPNWNFIFHKDVKDIFHPHHLNERAIERTKEAFRIN